MTGTVLSALLSHWRRNPLQLFTLLSGLALGTALWSGVQAINAEARASYSAAAATVGPAEYNLITARKGSKITQQIYITLRRAGWNVSPVVEGDLGTVRVVGIDPLTSPKGIGPISLGGDAEAANSNGADLTALIRLHDYAIYLHRQAIAQFAAGDVTQAIETNETSIAIHLQQPKFHAFAGQLWAVQGDFKVTADRGRPRSSSIQKIRSWPIVFQS